MVSEIPDLQSKDQEMKTMDSIPEEEDNLNIFTKTATYCGCFCINYSLISRY